MQEISAFIGNVVAYGGGGAAVAYLLFQFLGKKWIENKFQERLDALKHEQAKEVQRLKIEIDSLLGGVLKLQEREFSILPEAWRLLDEAKGLVAWVVHPMQEYPDLNRMDELRFEEILKSSDLSEADQADVRRASDHNKEYIRLIFWKRLSRVRKTHGELQSFVAKNAIFLPEAMKGRYEKICSLMWSAIVAKQIGHQADDWKMQEEGWDKVEKEIDPLYKEIEKESRARLRAHAISAGQSIPG
jgi:hypothetical protein